MKKIIPTILILLLTIVIVGASEFSTLGVLKPASLNQNYTILQTCASCTYVNVTVSNVNGILISDQSMISNGSGVWVYYMTPTTTSRHDVNGLGDKDGTDTSYATYFDVTPSGKVSSTGDSILYALFSCILFGLMGILSFFIVTLPYENDKDDGGFETGIVKLKYLRIILVFFMWPLTILLFNFLNGLAQNFTSLSMFSGILGFIFETMMRLTWPFIIVIIVWIVYLLIHDTNITKQLDKFTEFDPFRQ